MQADPKLTALIERLQRGERSALGGLIEATQEAAYQLALSYLRDRHAAQDALQESYLVVVDKIATLRDPSAFRTWFFRIVSNVCRQALRRRRPESSLEAVPEPQEPDSTDKVSERLAIRRAFAALSETDREILTLREVAQLSYQEMAEALDIPLGTVRSRLASARQNFVQIYQGETS